MARDRNTMAKRQRESLKKQKAVEKQQRRRMRKTGSDIRSEIVRSDHSESL